MLHVDDEGRLIPMEKVRGRRQSIDALAQHLFDTINEGEDTVFISHGDCIEDAKYLAGVIKKKLPVRIEINYIGPVIGSHSGPGTLALFYMGSHR